MRIPGLKSGKSFYRWLRAHAYGGALILGYHRISSPSRALDEACVSPENFAEHLYELRQRTNPIRLSKLVEHVKDGSVPAKSVAVTFDDGYADNLYSAKPLLEEYEIPATVFISTGYIGREFWWDELQRLVICSQEDPRALRLQAAGKQFEWDGKRMSSEAVQAIRRRDFHQALYWYLLSLDVEDQTEVMRAIRSWSKVPSTSITVPRAMREEEMLRLVDGGLIEVGAHTRHHPMLPQLTLERQREEIKSSKQDLEALLGKTITGFSYPNGRATPAAKHIVRELGFTYACTSQQDVVRPGSDFYALTRFWQQDVDGHSFMRGLRRWMKIGDG
jgi:peptidoglycan/xylan/chitin deacetylase (PgdA/CDA1 family)